MNRRRPAGAAGKHKATGPQAGGRLLFAAAALDLPWIAYGLAHREKPIVMTYTLWFLCNLAIALGALFYGGTVAL